MVLPDYWLTLTDGAIADPPRRAFDELLSATLARGDNPVIQYTPAAPKWQFLHYLAGQHRFVFHGSGHPDIVTFEPRQPIDLYEFGGQKAVYAAADGIWSMFYAIVDRDRHPMSICNACVHLTDAGGVTNGPYYVFSVSRQVLARQPWRNGVVYLLPPDTFVMQPTIRFGEYEALIPQLASPVPVAPLARLEVTPQDFPFLSHIRGHDDARLADYGNAMQTGAPWPDL